MPDRKGISSLIIAAIISVLFVTVGTLIAADTPDKINIENDGYKKDKKGAVAFSHNKHAVDYKVACTECHHIYEDGKNTWNENSPVKKCVECHDPNKKADKVLKLQFAFHNNCRKCHKVAAKKGAEAPYKKCNGCHSKK